MKIAVIGDVMLDNCLYGKVKRINPEAPTPILSDIKSVKSLGGAGNVYQNLLGLGVDAFLCGLIGRDKAGEQIRKMVNPKSRNGLLYYDGDTTTKVRFIAEGQQILRADKDANKQIDFSQMEIIISILQQFNPDAIILSDYGKGVVSKELAIRLKKVFNCFFAADPKHHMHIFNGFDVITPNEKELANHKGTLAGLIYHCNIKNVLVTRGEKGMTLHSNEVGKYKIATEKQSVCDVTGAGDTVVAVYTFAILLGYSEKTAASLANKAAGVVIKTQGVKAITIDELYPHIFPNGICQVTKKVWGREICFANTKKYCGKILELNQGAICSNHFHKLKDETFYILSGKVWFGINGSHKTLVPGDSIRIFPNDRHHFGGILPSIILEVSTTHYDDDSYRLDKSSEKWLDYEKYL